jgi:ZIP family zinc transporter
MWGSDKLVSFARRRADTEEGKRVNRILMLVLSITLHNIPEGLAVGVAFGALPNTAPETVMGAATIALGIGLQNFPEGAAVSLPLRREGWSRKKSFLLGQASGMVEPIAGVLGAWLVVYVEAMLPFALSFAAGAMILVAVHELIPECQQHQDTQPYVATMGIVGGFAVMTLLDVMLG